MSPLTLSVKLRGEFAILVGYTSLDLVKNFVCKRHLVLCYRDSPIQLSQVTVVHQYQLHFLKKTEEHEKHE